MTMLLQQFETCYTILCYMIIFYYILMLYCTNEILDLKISFFCEVFWTHLFLLRWRSLRWKFHRTSKNNIFSVFSAENLHHILFSFMVMIYNMRDQSSILDMVTIDSYIIDFWHDVTCPTYTVNIRTQINLSLLSYDTHQRDYLVYVCKSCFRNPLRYSISTS